MEALFFIFIIVFCLAFMPQILACALVLLGMLGMIIGIVAIALGDLVRGLFSWRKRS